MFKFAFIAILSSIVNTADKFWVEKDFEEFYNGPLDMNRYPNHT
jgi:hypothetical protein